MTYRELSAFLATLDDDQLGMDVTVCVILEGQEDDDGEFFAVKQAKAYLEDGVLDDNHPYLVVNTQS